MRINCFFVALLLWGFSLQAGRPIQMSDSGARDWIHEIKNSFYQAAAGKLTKKNLSAASLALSKLRDNNLREACKESKQDKELVKSEHIITTQCLLDRSIKECRAELQRMEWLVNHSCVLRQVRARRHYFNFEGERVPLLMDDIMRSTDFSDVGVGPYEDQDNTDHASDFLGAFNAMAYNSSSSLSSDNPNELTSSIGNSTLQNLDNPRWQTVSSRYYRNLTSSNTQGSQVTYTVPVVRFGTSPLPSNSNNLNRQYDSIVNHNSPVRNLGQLVSSLSGPSSPDTNSSRPELRRMGTGWTQLNHYHSNRGRPRNRYRNRYRNRRNGSRAQSGSSSDASIIDIDY